MMSQPKRQGTAHEQREKGHLMGGGAEFREETRHGEAVAEGSSTAHLG